MSELIVGHRKYDEKNFDRDFLLKKERFGIASFFVGCHEQDFSHWLSSWDDIFYFYSES